jgi:transcription-repair coupling factor (superfamily II helicase)
LNPEKLISFFKDHPQVSLLQEMLDQGSRNIHLKGTVGSGAALVLAGLFDRAGKQQHLVVLGGKEQAAYFYNDLENLFDEAETDYNKKKILFYPTSYKRPYEPENADRAYQLSRTEVLKRFMSGDRKTIVVTYPEALAEKVVAKQYVTRNTRGNYEHNQTRIRYRPPLPPPQRLGRQSDQFFYGHIKRVSKIAYFILSVTRTIYIKITISEF